MIAFEDETTITQKPCIRKSMSLERLQHKIEYNGGRKKFSAYISMSWPDKKLLYDFYDRMNSTNTINHLENLKSHVTNNGWKRLIIVWDNTSFHVSKMVRDHVNNQTVWLTIIHLPTKVLYLNPNERKVNQQIKLDVCANRFYPHIEEQKAAVSNYLDNRFGTWNSDRRYDT